MVVDNIILSRFAAKDLYPVTGDSLVTANALSN